jgi:Lon-like ATP-dependent protease
MDKAVSRIVPVDRGTKLMEQFKENMKKWTVPQHAKKVIDEEMARLANIDSATNSAEYYLCSNYLQWLTSVPWGFYSKDNFDLKKAEGQFSILVFPSVLFTHSLFFFVSFSAALDEQHYGLQDVKDRILEFIAVGALRKNLSVGKILCLVGPPGVGK